MTYVHVAVERVKGFLKWNPHRFESLDDKSAVAPLDPWGWRRNDEWWIRPPVWREHVCGGDLDPQELARTLKGLDLLRVQDNRNFQCAVKVKGATPKAYVINSALFEWKPPVSARSSRGFGGAGSGAFERVEEPRAALLSPQGSGSAAPAPTDLAQLLEEATRLALLKGIEVLSASASTEDRHYSQLLRSQTAFASGCINAQVRVDEAKLKAQQADDRRDKILAIVAEERARIKIIEASASVPPPERADPGGD